MGLQQLLESPVLDRPQRTLRQQFFDATGYGPADILSLNYSTRTFLTRNGGKYVVNSDGTIDHLDGPSPDAGDRF
jgi:hypothetical protein